MSRVRVRSTSLFVIVAMCLGLVVSLAAAELLLRLQQRLGPIVDLGPHQDEAYAEALRAARGYAVGRPGVLIHDPLSGRSPVFDTIASETGGRRGSAIVMGDSWGNHFFGAGIAAGLCEHDASCRVVVVGGVGSYSPSLYGIGVARMVKHMADVRLIVINIDETDIMQEWERQHFVVRDSLGRPMAVIQPATPYQWWPRIAAQRVGKFDSYLRRALERYLYSALAFPRFMDVVWSIDTLTPASHMYDVQLSRDPRREFDVVLRHFEREVSTMLDVIHDLAGDSIKVVVSHHPHFRGLRGGAYNAVLEEVLRTQARERGVGCVLSRGFLGLIHGTLEPRSWFRPNDPHSHLTNDGYERYGRFVGRRVASNTLDCSD